MGLDITAYMNIELVSEDIVECDCDYGETILYVNPAFPAQADGLKTGRYTYWKCYPKTFRAGSYSYYNEWRAWLAKLVGKTDKEIWKNPQPGPFVELINFADNEGVIGPETSKKLYQDFTDHFRDALKAIEKTPADDGFWYMTNYINFASAFDHASCKGAVCFH